MNKPIKKMYIVWNMTNYGNGYEFLGAYTTKAKAQKAYNSEMKARYGTTNIDKLIDLWSNDGGDDSWRIEEVEVVE